MHVWYVEIDQLQDTPASGEEDNFKKLSMYFHYKKLDFHFHRTPLPKIQSSVEIDPAILWKRFLKVHFDIISL